MSHRKPQNPRDKQEAHTGKIENDHNKLGDKHPTQKNEGKRTPLSRNDRESNIGTNQTVARRGGVNSGVAGRR